MSKSMNKVFLLGNVGKDPETKSTPSGTIVANFSLATTDRRKDGQGSWVDETCWHTLVCFGRTAEIARDYVKKGTPVHVEGRLQTRSWDDKQSGQKRYKTEIVVENLILLGGGEGKRQAKPASTSPTWEEVGSQAITDDDIPF